MIVPTTHYAYYSSLLRPLLQYFVRSMLPIKWYHRHEHNIHSLLRSKESDADDLPAVGSPGGLCSIMVSHHPMSVLIDKFYALQNGPPNSSQQIFVWTTLRNSLMPSKTPLRPAPSPSSPFPP